MLDPLVILSRHPYFSSLSADTLKTVGRHLVVRTYEKNMLVFVEGEPAVGLYLVASGSVRVFKASEEGREQDLFHVAAGESFNNAPAFDGGPTYATAQATEPSTILLIRRDALLALMGRYPEIGQAVARVLAGQLREVAHLAGDLSLRHTASRVASLLLRLSDGRSTVPLPTRHELAAMVGTVREVATRTLRHLEQAGAIRLAPRGYVTILDRQALERLGGQPWPGVS